MSNTSVYILTDETKTPIINSEKLTGREKFLMHFCNRHIEYYEIFDNLDDANKRKKILDSLSEDKIESFLEFNGYPC